MLQSFFNTCGSLVSIYSFACLIRIFLTWMPQLEYSSFGRFLSGLCDPFLNWFRRFPFTRVGAVDFSPILAFGVLSVASMVFSTLAATGHITVGFILAGFVQVIWQFLGFFLTIIILFLVIRLIYDLFNRYGYSQFWTMLDRFLNKPISWVTGFFNHSRRPMGYRASLVLTLVVMLVLRVGLEYGVQYLVKILTALPL
jgi:YggT family protein